LGLGDLDIEPTLSTTLGDCLQLSPPWLPVLQAYLS